MTFSSFLILIKRDCKLSLKQMDGLTDQARQRGEGHKQVSWAPKWTQCRVACTPCIGALTASVRHKKNRMLLENKLIYLENRICIAANIDKVWNALTDLENVNLWVPEILEAKCPEGKKRGSCAERSCKLKGNIVIKEKWLSWEESNSFSYVATGMPIIKSAVNRWELKEEDAGTLVISRAEIEIGGGIIGKLLSYPMRPYMRKMGPRTLALLKYWVEHEKPYSGKVSELAMGPITC